MNLKLIYLSIQKKFHFDNFGAFVTQGKMKRLMEMKEYGGMGYVNFAKCVFRKGSSRVP